MKNRSNFKKCVGAAALIFALIAALPIYGFAAEVSGEVISDTAKGETIQSNEAIEQAADVEIGKDTPEKVSDTGDGYGAEAGGNNIYTGAEDKPIASGEATDEYENAFAAAFAAVNDNMAKILSALAFIGSLIIMLCYKRGLIPLIKEGLAALAAGVKNISQKNDALEGESERLIAALEDKIAKLDEHMARIEDAERSIKESDKELQLDREERQRVRRVLLCEVDMLYEIFNSAALPQYLKEQVGERVCAMRRELDGGIAENEDNS